MPTLIALLVLLCVGTHAIAAPTTVALTDANTVDRQGKNPDFDAWLKAFRSEAQAAGIAPETLDRAFAGVSVSADVLELDRKQTRQTVTLKEYLDSRVSEWRIQKGREKLQQHHEVLAQIERAYGVQPRFIVAFWGIETNFGSYTGRQDVFQALTTLAWDPRRASYFRQELIAALRIMQDYGVSREQLKGSWAGALGQPQFMPSNYLRFAEDFDGDGVADIWSSEPDALASIARYLKEHGWRDDHTWGRPVNVPDSLRNHLEQWRPARSEVSCGAMAVHTRPKALQEWQELGVRRLDQGPLPLRGDLEATLVVPDMQSGQAYLTYSNYKGILKYNCSNFYALSVAKLSDQFR